MIPLDWFSPAEREVWILRGQGLKNPEIAKRLGLEPQHVAVTYCYAKARWLRGGPKAAGRSAREAWNEMRRIDRRLEKGEPCLRCGLHGEHVCLFGSGADRRAPQWMSSDND